MAYDAFLKFEPAVAGESTAVGHQNEIDIVSWSFGETRAAAAGGGGQHAGRVSMTDFHFTKRVDKASPALFLAVASGTHYKTATLSVRNGAFQEGQDFLKYKLSTVLVTSFSLEGHGEGSQERELDSFSLAFQKIQITYTPTSPAGVAAPADEGVDVTWDLSADGGGG
ncbi:MAG: type VI secretion system tube protein Hcp [Chloroflexi bacterium]|nr:MAG: type VI secretion system tube protein Hcp [Chloroflexota bacterium]